MTTPPLLPTPTLAKIYARTAQASWPVPAQNSPWTRFQLSVTDDLEPRWEIAYEGASASTEVRDLKPETRYRLRLRAAVPGMADGVWGKEAVEVFFVTTDESLNVRLTAQILRAVGINDAVAVDALLSEHAAQISLETRDRYGKTLLMIACQTGTPEIVNKLLRAGASANATTRSGKTPLSLACSTINLATATALLAFDPTTVDSADSGGSTPLMWAVENAGTTQKGVDLVTLLLSHGAAVDREDATRKTALDRLCACTTGGNVAVAALLVQAGARIVRTPSKRNPMSTLMVAAMNGHLDLCVALVDRWRCDPRVVTEHGGTARSFAASAGHVHVATVLEERVKIWSHDELAP
ncbi:ankyrin repeat-containing domain protein [Blyttiomyces helicus]|uniref:Ankyrin repeat-containing domain protein n=1 Tax=Blyttiomyces helicus TaxID=388810 RepID=A0A4P9VZ56_9FUNG|nr:ankyrin repeat-containing domain protein [Blyttiomyces helicus]|eukprot:RKO83628.1 ankyrin repeat-containing domain protein [Blyttiomyces helicus]